MGVVWCRELPRERSQSGKFKETYEYVRAWLVRVDSVNTPLPDITNAAGVDYLDTHPDDLSCGAMEFTTQAIDDTGLLYSIRVKYFTPPPDQGEGGEGDQPTYIEGLMRNPVWSGSSTVTTTPIYTDRQGDIITNSAGDPLEGIEAEAAEFRLTLTGYYLTHTAWVTNARVYTNAVNSDTWMGGSPGEWKCQGCSAQLQTENKSGISYIYWEVTWEFAYRAGGWQPKPWDVGFHERVNEDGEPSAAGTKRRVITGSDGKAVRQPVALANGIAKTPGSPPDVVNNGAGVLWYFEVPFGAQFGSVYTPTVPDN